MTGVVSSDVVVMAAGEASALRCLVVDDEPHLRRLHKAGPLTEEEYRHVMEHPVTGWRTLQPLLRDHSIALNVVRSHHERWDGAGLPDRLRGEAIPLAARIAAVADTFDAMTSHRSYRPQLSVASTVEEIIGYRGTQFDSRAVDAFVAVVGRGEIPVVSEDV